MAKPSKTAAPETGLAEGFTCVCGKYEEFPGYVYAHWREELTYTCECKRKYHLLEGVCTPK